MKTFTTILLLITTLSLTSQVSNIKLGVPDSTELIKNSQKVSLATKLVSQNEKIAVKVSPQTYGVHEYYLNNGVVLISENNEEHLVIEDIGVVSVKVSDIKSNQGSAFLSYCIYLNSLPNFE